LVTNTILSSYAIKSRYKLNFFLSKRFKVTNSHFFQEHESIIVCVCQEEYDILKKGNLFWLRERGKSQFGFVQKYLVHYKKENGPSQQKHFIKCVDCFDDINLCFFSCRVTKLRRPIFLEGIFGITHFFSSIKIVFVWLFKMFILYWVLFITTEKFCSVWWGQRLNELDSLIFWKVVHFLEFIAR
jgi:hypothetical protein